MQNGNENENSTFQKKPGRTLLIKQLSMDDNLTLLFGELNGLKSTFKTEKSMSFFLTFDSVQNSTDSYEHLKTFDTQLKVKYAHYRVFFTIKGLEENSDYNTIKNLHTKYIEDNTNGTVLYYKLYRKNNSFLECGDLTVDTKESFDSLMTESSGVRNYTLDNGLLTGSHFRYNKQTQGHPKEH